MVNIIVYGVQFIYAMKKKIIAGITIMPDA